MLKILIFFLFFLFLLFFGYANNQNVELVIFPEKLISLPLYLFFFLNLAIGIILASIYNIFKKKND
ncbi:MAG: hypothetical protein CBE11_03055 [Rickettsiales bacterium TMED251]|nr:MAG: hypothetical protein CBE11_03055 [Rickettsiales bacterium TMED251]